MTIAAFIKLQMFIEQSKKGYGQSASFKPAQPTLGFSKWKVGHFIKSESAPDEFKITKIESADGAMHNEDCTVTLESATGETRQLKGSSLRSRYQFVSFGDTINLEEPPPRDDVMAFYVNPLGIREFYPRKQGEGSRILMMDKTAYIVADTAEDIAKMILRAGGYTGAGIVGEVNRNQE